MTPAIASFIWAISLVAWALIRVPHQTRARKIAVVKNAKTLGDHLSLAAAALGLSVVPLLYVVTRRPVFADYAFHPAFGWTGLVVELLFLGIFYESHRQLGKNWSVTLEIRDDHKLVTSGLYRYIRHPMYLSFWLWSIGQLFLLPNLVAGAAGLVGVAILYFSRIHKEETLMRETFGASYDDYARRTRRIIPIPW